ncbi:MAG: DinB family protein [Acidobacteriota bacterium]
MVRITRPEQGEYLEFYQGYLDALADEADGLVALERQVPAIEALSRLTPEQAAFRYAEGKWSTREVVGHLIDSERVFSYRLLRVSRGDETPLPGFDEGLMARRSNADRRPIAELAAELLAVRRSTLALVRSLEDEMLLRRGTVNNGPATTRALVFITAGHLAHHLRVLRERYAIEL